MKTNKSARQMARRLLRATFDESGRIQDDRIHTVIRYYSEKKPRNYLPTLYAYYQLLRLEKGRKSARIETAHALSTVDQAHLQNKITEKYGSNLEFQFIQNTALLGGIKMTIGNHLIDASLKNRLKELEKNF